VGSKSERSSAMAMNVRGWPCEWRRSLWNTLDEKIRHARLRLANDFRLRHSRCGFRLHRRHRSGFKTRKSRAADRAVVLTHRSSADALPYVPLPPP
jgi:hypothetical protein